MEVRINKEVAWLSGVVYFIQGALGIAGIALPLYLRDQNFSITKIASISALAAAPWFFKIIFGSISDAFPIRGLRRKPYLIICSALSSLGWILLGCLPAQEMYILLAMWIANIGLAATDVITDGLVVDSSDDGSAQVYQSISWGSRSLGALLSGITGGILASKLDFRLIFCLTGALPLISLFWALLLKEKPEQGIGKGFADVLKPLMGSLRILFSGDLKWFALLLLIASSSASFATPFFFYLHEKLKFSEVMLGLLQSVTWLGTIIGCGLFVKFFKTASLKKTLYISFAISFFDLLFVLAIRDPLSANIVFLVGGILGYVSLLPLMSASAKLAHNTGVESSLFAILMSLFNVGKIVSSLIGAQVAERVGLSGLIIATAILGLTGFLVIPKLKTL